MNVSLTPELENMVQAQVASGKYGNASEVIRDALRLMIQRDVSGHYYEEWLRAEIEIGWAQSEQGQIEDHTMQSIKDFVLAERQNKSG